MKQKQLIIPIIIIVLTGALMTIPHKINNQQQILTIKLKGDRLIHLNSKEKYYEPGFEAIDQMNGNLTKQVQVTIPTIKNNGTYEITYQVTNSKGEIATEKRFLIIQDSSYKQEYDQIDNSLKSWWSNNKKDGTRPIGGYNYQELKKYNATFLGPDEKVIYLTFDEGSNDTYIKEIADILNLNNIKATFFFCQNFLETNQELIKDLVKNGHSIGNHTANHRQIRKYANKDDYKTLIKEINGVEETFLKITGRNIDKVYRDPKGEYSLRSLQIMKDLGYKTFFYSADYLDWDKEVTKEYALEQLKKEFTTVLFI